MLFLMDENFCFQCFCTEKYEKCVRPDKDLSIKAAPQGREYKKKRLLCRNRATDQPRNRAARQPANRETGLPSNRPTNLPLVFFKVKCNQVIHFLAVIMRPEYCQNFF